MKNSLTNDLRNVRQETKYYTTLDINTRINGRQLFSKLVPR